MADPSSRRSGVPFPAVLVVSDGSADRERVIQLGLAAARGGAWGYALREPGLGGRWLYEATLALRAQAPKLRLIVNDRADVALAARAFGVQLGERGLAVGRVRRGLDTRLRIGRSVHDVAGAEQADVEGADWLLFGHVFDTPSKPGLRPKGIEGLAAVVRSSQRPVLAIGGIDVARVGAVLAAGACGVAVIGAVARAPDPSAATQRLVEALNNWRASKGGA